MHEIPSVSYIESGVAGNQCGFRKDKSTNDQVFNNRLILQKEGSLRIILDNRLKSSLQFGKVGWASLRRIGLTYISDEDGLTWVTVTDKEQW